MKYGGEKANRISFDVKLPGFDRLKFVLGGKHLVYPGINAQFRRLFLGVGLGAFIDTEDQLNEWIGARA